MSQTEFGIRPTPRQFTWIVLLTSLWVHVSEVARYFGYVIPATRSFHGNRAGIAEMDLRIFAIWGLWDTLLTVIVVTATWFAIQVHGVRPLAWMGAATFVWFAFFVLFWVGSANMGLSSWHTLWIALPLSWVEMVVAAWIAATLLQRKTLGETSAVTA